MQRTNILAVKNFLNDIIFYLPPNTQHFLQAWILFLELDISNRTVG